MFLGVVLTIVGLLALSTVYHQIRKLTEVKKNTPPGEVIKVGDSEMHIYGQGEGSPTILFTCGNGLGFTLGNFYPTISKLSERYRVVAYDRFGYGWSGSTSRPRTLERINEELFEILDKSRETGPFVLVGHSFGATESIQFAKRYPELVAGVVSLDGTSPAFYEGRKDLYKQNIVASSLLRFLSFTGLLRVISNLGLFTTTGESTPKEIVRVTNMMTYNRVYSKEAVEEVMALIYGDVEKGTLGDIPVLVLTADNEKLKKKQPEMYQDFVNSQTDLLALSTRSQQKIIEDADHFFPIKMPDVVTDELQSFLDAYAAKA